VNSPIQHSSEPLAHTPQSGAVRVLCLGNELLGDDALGIRVASALRQFAPEDIEIITTPESGFYLLDYILNVDRLIVVDTVVTGAVPPGTIYVFHDNELQAAPGASPHYVGLSETLGVARKLSLPVAKEIVIMAVEAADCLTLGAEIHPAVSGAIPVLVNAIRDAATKGAEIKRVPVFIETQEE